MIAWLQDPATVCTSRSALETIFPEIASSGVDIEKVQQAFCELASTLTAKDGDELSLSYMFAVDNITKLSQKVHLPLFSSVINSPSVNAKNYHALESYWFSWSQGIMAYLVDPGQWKNNPGVSIFHLWLVVRSKQHLVEKVHDQTWRGYFTGSSPTSTCWQ